MKIETLFHGVVITSIVLAAVLSALTVIINR